MENVVLLTHKIRYPLADEFHLQGEALGIRAVEDDEVIKPKRGVRFPNPLDQLSRWTWLPSPPTATK